MIKKFIELYDVDVPITKKPTFKLNKATREYEEVKGKELDTLTWVDCLTCLYENGAEKVIFENVPNEKGELLYKDENNAISIKVFVEIDGDRREIIYPIIDGTKDVSIEKLKQSDIYNAKQRAFVKCVAVNWGLGLKLWKKADRDKTEKEEEKSLAEQFRALVNTAVKKLGSIPEMLKHLNGVSEKKIKELIENAKDIDGITKTLIKVVEDDNKSK